jgi:hypothetical protein
MPSRTPSIIGIHETLTQVEEPTAKQQPTHCSGATETVWRSNRTWRCCSNPRVSSNVRQLLHQASGNAARLFANEEAVGLSKQAIANAERLHGVARYSRVLAAAMQMARFHLDAVPLRRGG